MYGVVAWLVDNLFQLFILSLVFRALLDLVRSFSPSYKPQGLWLWLAGVILLLSDWVLWPVKKIIKPIRLGPVVFDLAWSVTMIILFIAQSAMANVVYAIFHYVG